ncbi:hypothetical protein ACRASX_02390 [Flavobacterium sp. TMP13]|uniref:hypothetical protein n=1 Tax=Flavobacterium sp. TMP13 TaxID=3425950 RepID=UPI003D77982D
MKTKFFTGILFILMQLGFAQTNDRKLLNGKVQNDSLAIESGYVLNINAQTRTYIYKDGAFAIMAKAKDTLLFSGMVFQSKKIVVKAADFQEKAVLIQLELINNQLNEVVVGSKFKDESLSGGTQVIVDGQYFDDANSSPTNQVMHSNQTIKDGIDFVRMFKEVKKALKPKPEDKQEYIEDITFSKYAQANFSPTFYREELRLKEDEIDLFLMYCANDRESRKYLKPESKFQLIDFLINKNKEYKRIVTFEK